MSVCEPAVQWAIEYALLCNPPVLWRTTPIIKYSWPTCYFGMPGLGRASQIWQIASLHGIRWKPSDDKKPAWNRAKVSRASPSKIQAYKHAKFESLIPRATIASAKRSNILSSKHRGLERSAAEAVACKLSFCNFLIMEILVYKLFSTAQWSSRLQLFNFSLITLA